MHVNNKGGYLKKHTTIYERSRLSSGFTTVSQRAFTIVELLIVIVVIGILAALTIVAYNGIQDRAQQSAAQSATSQASKKLQTYFLTNADTYPPDLATAGITNSGNTTYQYSYNNSVNPKTYCITTTITTISYYQNNTTQPSPAPGGCPGHGVGGVAAVTNYYVDPKPNQTTPVSAWSGGNTLVYTNVSSSWSDSGKANRMAFTAVSSNSGGPTIGLSSSYLPNADQKFTVVASLRLIAGTGSITGLSFDRNVNTGTVVVHSSGGVSVMTTGQTYKVYITFTADSIAVQPSNGPRFYIGIGSKNSSTIVEIADIDMYPGDYNASRGWGSGDSPNWVWNGTPHNSTSTGPPL